jgi:hypothetical protein
VRKALNLQGRSVRGSFPLSMAFLPAQLLRARLRLDARTLHDIGILGLSKEEETNDDRHEGHADWIVEAGINVPGLRHDRRRKQRQHSPEPTVTDMVGQRHRRVPDLGREQLDQEGSDRPCSRRKLTRRMGAVQPMPGT